MNHTPEPLVVEFTKDTQEVYITAENGDPDLAQTIWHGLASVWGDDDDQERGRQKAIKNALRLVRCYNACAGMEDPAKEIERLRARLAELEAEVAHTILDATAHLVDAKARAEQAVNDLAAAIERLPV